MLWDGAVVAGFAHQAGFRGEPLVVAVACALAGTGGDDTAHDLYGHPATVDRRGLWLVDVVAYPDYADVDLYDPRVNAAAAYRLYDAAGRTFAWSPVYVADGHVVALDAASEAAQRPTLRQRVSTDPLSPVVSRSVRRAHEYLERLTRRLAE